MEAMVTVETEVNGYNIDRENLKLLEIGKLYEVEDFRLGSYSSSVHLVGFDKVFNSVNFEFYKDGKEVDPHKMSSYYEW